MTCSSEAAALLLYDTVVEAPSLLNDGVYCGMLRGCEETSSVFHHISIKAICG